MKHFRINVGTWVTPKQEYRHFFGTSIQDKELEVTKIFDSNNKTFVELRVLPKSPFRIPFTLSLETVEREFSLTKLVL